MIIGEIWKLCGAVLNRESWIGSREDDIAGFCQAFEQEESDLGRDNLNRLYGQRMTVFLADRPGR